MKIEQRLFDTSYQQAKGDYWRISHERLLEMQSNDPQEFWKHIGQFGIAQKRKKKIPCEVIRADGSTTRDK